MSDWLFREVMGDIYLQAKPSYRAADQGIVSLSELRAVSGVNTPLFYEKLSSHLTAFPEDQCQIDINYASIKSFFNT